MNHGIAYLNGNWIPSAELSLGVDDFGPLMGVTLSEKLRTFKGQPYHVPAHIARLKNSLAIMSWNAEAIGNEARQAVEEFVVRNRELIGEGDDWNITLFVTPGKTAKASNPTICVHGYPIPFHQWAHQFVEGVEGLIVSIRQVPVNCWPAELKCRSRMHYYLADREAARQSKNARAILLDQDGYIGEGSTANVIAYFKDRGLVTPKIEKVLPGVSQDVVFDLAESMGITHVEQDMQPAKLLQADEVFFASTSICLLPVTRIDGLPISDGMPGPIYQKLLAAWSDEVGIDIAAQAQKFAVR